MRRHTWIACMALACTAACSDAFVAGNYTGTVTNRENGCSIGAWNEGQGAQVSFNVTQSGSNLTLTVNGLPGVAVAALLGGSEFNGDVDGDDVNLQRLSTLPPMENGNCEFKFNGKIIAGQDGDFMSGRVEYRAETNNHEDCGSRNGCLSKQEFNATRPPPGPAE